MPPGKLLPQHRVTEPIDLLAQTIEAKRETLLRAYRTQLPREDLEDCIGQASLELLVRARRPGGGFQSAAHIANALEQKLRSRINDLHRARGGRSSMASALASAAVLDEVSAPADPRADVEAAVGARMELGRLIVLTRTLSGDQRLALAHEVLIGTSSEDFCERFGWSTAKLRKVRQRARAKLRLAGGGA
ncbi:MAG: sigma-70 RNA polymerase sigma factor region 4 domain-containing protein [Solirubrobacteraceae bacterium]